MAAQLVTVEVPDGVYEGFDFNIILDGLELTVCCPDGKGPGDLIELEVPAADGAPPNLVDVEVPDGCTAGTEFTVNFEGREFNITVPDGVGPGEMLTVEVPAAEPEPEPSPAPKSPAPQQQKKPPKMELAEIPAFGGRGGVAPRRDTPSAASKSKYLEGLDIPAFRGPMKGVTANSVNSLAKWNQEGARSLFDMMPDMGYGREAGDFAVGQLVQVARSNGSWTYGKIMDYDGSGDHYSIMTKAGAKYFVERDDITTELCQNPLTGGWARE